MRIAIISDMHGNVNAMKATLADMEAVGYDAIVCLGDVTAVGPQPQETLNLVKDLECPMIMGNHDQWLLNQDDLLLVPENNRVDGYLFRVIRNIDSWCRAQLTEAELDYISTFKPWHLMDTGDTEILFYHGSPRANTDLVLATTDTDMDELMLSGHNAPVMVGGHSHLQMVRRHYEKLLINVGSVGAPFYYTRKGEIRNPWWAEYGIITIDGEHISVDLRRVFYDVEDTVKRLRESGMPHVDWYLDARD
ncbi:MAG: metallophosphoesterase family protein [Anaerolineae bacterium]